MSPTSNGKRNFRLSVTQGISEYFAVLLADYQDMDWETAVVISGIGRQGTRGEAEDEARDWAKAEEIPLELWPTLKILSTYI